MVTKASHTYIRSFESGVVQHDTDVHWYVLRVTYQRELSTQEQLNKMGINNFVPTLKIRKRNSQGRFYWIREVAVHNYVFVQTSKQMIDRLKHQTLPHLRYIMRNVNGERRIMTVPEREMQNFIAVAGNAEEHIRFLPPEEVMLAEGDRVRILGGPFEGVEGNLIKTSKGKRTAVVIRIEGIAAVVTTSLPMRLIEKI